MTPQDVTDYFATLATMPALAQVTDRAGTPVALGEFFRTVIDWSRATHASGNTIHFVGNGGSAAVASHMAIDFSKNGGMRARAHNDASALTCLANDYSFEEVFARQIAMHARPGDLVVAISSSGRSQNILNAVKAARAALCRVVTLSGFGEDNPLRTRGDLNAYVPTSEYGFVEIAHLSLCHAVVDLANGWSARPAAKSAPRPVRAAAVGA